MDGESYITPDPASTIPFTLLKNELLSRHAKIGTRGEGDLFLTNYRLYAQPNTFEPSIFNVPVRLVDYALPVDAQTIRINCRHGFAFRLRFFEVSSAINCVLLINSLAAYSPFQLVIRYEPGPIPTDRNVICLSDYQRLGLNAHPLKISAINKDHRLCPHYPEYLCIPSDISSSEIQQSSKFRAASRVISIVYRHEHNGVCLARGGQPGPGILCYRNSADEKALKCLSEVSGTAGSAETVFIVDARDGTAAYWNRARGGGYEYNDYYVGSKIFFMSIANIHAARSALSTLRDAIYEGTHKSNFERRFRESGWSDFIYTIIKAAKFVASAIHEKGKPVLVHCSDGWDRTPQMVSLAKLMLDPYYRTIVGFMVLIEIEWIAYGHRFISRCQSDKDSHERAPIFLQWLECVHNLLKLYPTLFEFNEHLLVKVGMHCYLSYFDTFSKSEAKPEVNSRKLGVSLVDMQISESTRMTNESSTVVDTRVNGHAEEYDLDEMTSLWRFLLSDVEDYTNPFYTAPIRQEVLLPDIHSAMNITFWTGMYTHGKSQDPPLKVSSRRLSSSRCYSMTWFTGPLPATDDELSDESQPSARGELPAMPLSKIGSPAHKHDSEPITTAEIPIRRRARLNTSSDRFGRSSSHPNLVWAYSPPKTSNSSTSTRDLQCSRSPFEIIEMERFFPSSSFATSNLSESRLSDHQQSRGQLLASSQRLRRESFGRPHSMDHLGALVGPTVSLDDVVDLDNSNSSWYFDRMSKESLCDYDLSITSKIDLNSSRAWMQCALASRAADLLISSSTKMKCERALAKLKSCQQTKGVSRRYHIGQDGLLCDFDHVHEVARVIISNQTDAIESLKILLSGLMKSERQRYDSNFDRQNSETITSNLRPSDNQPLTSLRNQTAHCPEPSGRSDEVRGVEDSCWDIFRMNGAELQTSSEDSSGDENVDDRLSTFRSSPGHCPNCHTKFRWLLKPRVKCRLCERYFCKSCCENKIQAAARALLDKHRLCTDSNLNHCSTTCGLATTLRICDSCKQSGTTDCRI